MEAKDLRHHLGAHLLYALFWLLSLLPFRLLYALSDIAYLVVRHVVRYRREVVRGNLASAFPEKSVCELRDIERRFYHYFCDQFVETVKSVSMSRAQMMRHMEFVGLDSARQLCSAQRPLLIVMLGHYGNWEWIASLQYWLTDFHCTQIYHRLRQRTWDELFLRIRQHYGGESIPMRNTVRRVVQMTRSGQPSVIGFIADQQPRWDSISYFTPFLNHESAAFTGAEHISKRTASVMVYGRVSRVKRGYYRCEIVPMSAEPASVPDFQLTDHYFRLLEQDIRRCPEIWLWSHKRWTRTKELWLKRKAQKKAANTGNGSHAENVTPAEKS